MKAKRNLLRQMIRFGGTLALIGVTTFVLKVAIPYLEIQIIALLFLLPVILSTVLWGLIPGILAAFLGFLAFNYFFIQPYNTLLIHQTRDVIFLIIFLLVAVVVSQLIGQARQAEQVARKREWEAMRMYELISSLAGLTTVQTIIETLAGKLIDTFHFRQVLISVPVSQKGKPINYCSRQDDLLPEPCELSLSMFTDRNIEGEIRLWFDQNDLSVEETRLLAAFSNQGALAIERVRLVERENIVRVLEESDRVKTSLLNSVSHELRSPLAAIKASASSLRSGAVDWDTPSRKELVATIDEEADALNLLVGNLLDMSRIEAGALQPLKKWNSILEILKGVETSMQSLLVKHPLTIEIPDDYPLIPTDYVMIGQVFTNLVSNCVKYAPDDSPIVISAVVSGDSAVIKIVNNSPNVPDEHLEHIFDKFFRITDADKITGTGLGLSICKGIVEAHEGRIWAENLENGFCFYISLPLSLNGKYPQIPQDENNG